MLAGMYAYSLVNKSGKNEEEDGIWDRWVCRDGKKQLTLEVRRRRAALELESGGGAGAGIAPFLAVVVIEVEIQN